jgi:hypothetical protein
LRQRRFHLDPARTGDEGRRRPERVRGDSSRHRRHRPGVECLEDRRLLSAITEFPLPAGDVAPGNLTVGPDGNLWFTDFPDSVGRIDRIDPTPPRVTRVVAVAHPGKAITSILLRFDGALDPGSARKGSFYSLATGVANGQTIVFSQGVKIARVTYDRAARAVRLKLAVPQKGPVQVTVRAGLVAADGMSSFRDFTAVVT